LPTCLIYLGALLADYIFEPFMPNACEKIRKYLKIEDKSWNFIEPKVGTKLEDIEPLFVRI